MQKIRWFTYMIRCSNSSLYTGSTNHLIRRWHQHCNGTGSRYLKVYKPEAMVYAESHPDRSAACRREHQIKQLSKKEKESLIREIMSQGISV